MQANRIATYLVAGALGLLCLTAAALLRSCERLRQLEDESTRLEFQAREQEILRLFHAEIEAWEAERQNQTLFVSRKVRAAGETVTKIPAFFAAKAKECGLALVHATPDVMSFAEKFKLLKVDVRVAGSFLRFRPFLIALATVPFVDHIETIRVERVKGTRQLDVTLWLGLQ